jgi:DNA invertase Pin-like site-specific DNA recombinase
MLLAYSYLRFSSPQQWTGDSVRRQTHDRENWLKAHPDVELDKSLVMTDAGRSAFRRKNWDTYALARFVEHIKSGRVKPGSYLLVENLDRLSREDAGEATELFLSIVNKGVIVVQLSPAVMEFRRPVNMHSLMFAVVELSRGHSESAIKSERGLAWWARKQDEASKRIVTRRLPGWMKQDDKGRAVLDDRGRPVLDPERAKVVRRIFALARDGYGVQAIAKKLNAEGVPVMGRKEIAVRGQSHLPPDEREKRPVAWSSAVIWHTLKSRATIGEYVPYRSRGDQAGPPVPNYFPAVIDPETFHAVQGAIATRGRVGRGRRGGHVNLFAGLLRDARDGGTLSYWHTGKHPPVLISVNAKEGRGTEWTSFPAEPFDDAVISALAEVPAAEIQADNKAARKVEVIAGRLAEIDALVKLWTAKMDNPALVDTVAAKLAALNTERRKLAAEQAAAQREAANPLTESWGEFRNLAEQWKKASPELREQPEFRERIRAALRRSIESVTCLFVRRGRAGLAALRIDFAGAASHKDFAIMVRPATAGSVGVRPATWWARSLAAVAPGKLDLRKPDHAAELAEALEAVDLSAAEAAPAGQKRRRKTA